MLCYAAPMEGITTYIYRNAHARWYGGIDKYFTPFIAGRKMTPRERRDILPENNTGLVVIPQVLTNRAEDFLDIAGRLASYGYDAVNLNLGCPSGTVTAKKRGAGFLSDLDALDAFLYEIYEKCPLQISVKTRLGVSDLKEWNNLLDLYAKYPIQELIVHTRLLQEFYTGPTHPEAYADAIRRLRSTGITLCYNGDILSRESLQQTADIVMKTTPSGLDHVMIGRGLLKNPSLANQLHHSDPGIEGRNTGSRHDLKTLRAFHDEILDGYRQIMSGDLPVLFKMKDLWTYMISVFTDLDPANANSVTSNTASTSSSIGSVRQNAALYLKKIRKADRLSEYKIAVDNLFREYCP